MARGDAGDKNLSARDSQGPEGDSPSPTPRRRHPRPPAGTWNLAPSAEVIRARRAADSLDGVSSAGDTLRHYLSGEFGGNLSEAQRAAAAWYGCNGNVERKHTTGVYLRAGRGKGSAPVLGVYVDSSSRLTDFTAQREIYLSRLANYGFAVSGIEFRLSKQRYVKAQPGQERKEERAPLPELSPQEAAEVQDLVADVPEPLKTSVSRAVKYSFMKQKAKDTQDGR